MWLTYFTLLSIFSFLLFMIDKWLAIYHKRRISENTLLLSALLGGAYGSCIGMLIFHHKTRKLKFKLLMPLFILLNSLIIFLINYV